jgi:hypothetical protein
MQMEHRRTSCLVKRHQNFSILDVIPNFGVQRFILGVEVN